MKTIDEEKLQSDTAYRFKYVSEFIGFDDEDAKTINQAAGHLAPQFAGMVEATYEKLLAYDVTARHFVDRQHGYDGPIPASVEDVSANHEQIQFRKEHLSRYFMHLVGRPYNDKMAHYLDMVGKMHTPAAGNAAIDVPLVQMNALMGAISDVLFDVIFQLSLEDDAKHRMLRAFNKLLWIQNDLITRHYEGRRAAGAEAAV